ncbi:WG repeat-containing protein [Nafulsella turpanensis]|uniref:WG repeat-containing protein n=1 Tax=Nafulsella turpanensis TaxID=1265690 RepID=UPI00034AB3D6|nr:WG repeat-containing protein [Nafulsella turpanensis]
MQKRVLQGFLFIILPFFSSSLFATEPAYEVIPDLLYQLERKILIKREGSKYGLVNQKGKELIPAKYDSLLYTELQDQYIAYLDRQEHQKVAGVISERDKKIIPIDYNHIVPVALTLYSVENFSGTAALFDSDGKQKTDFKFAAITAFKGELARFYQNGKAGVINKKGEILLDARYKDVIIRSDSTVDAVHLRNWKILDGQNKLLNELQFDSIRPLGKDRWATSINFYNAAGQPTLMTALTNSKWEQLIGYRPMFIYPFDDSREKQVAKIEEKGRFGVINAAGEYLLPAEFDSIALTNRAIVAGLRVNREWYWHVFDFNGKKVSRETYRAVVPQKDDLMPVKLNDRWGYIDQQGKEVLICRYDSTNAFEGAYARVRYSGSMGIINREGLWQVRPMAEHISMATPTRFVARTPNAYLLLNEEGKELLRTPHALKPVEGGLLEINEQLQYGLFDLNGKRLTPTTYEWISELQEGDIFLARKNGRKGILSRDGKSFIPESADTFDQLFDMSEGFLAVEIGGQQGFVDTQGRLRISNRYDSVSLFSAGFAAIKLMGQWGYIDKMERLRVQPLYEAAGPFEEGMAIIRKNGAYGVINENGKVIIRPEYEKIQSLQSGRFLIVKDGQMGITDKNARSLLSAKYDHIEDLKNGYFLVERNGRKGLVNYEGISTIPLMYDILLWDELNQLYLASAEGEKIERKVIR